MISYLARRVLSGLVTLFLVVLLTFILVRLAPGDPVSYMAGLTAPAGYIEELTKKLGLDKPAPEQLAIYLSSLARGDLGFSFSWGRPVNDIIVSRLPATVLLMATAFILSLVLGVVAGVVASRLPYGRVDNAVTLSSLAAFSMPQFWVGMILLLIFGLWLRLLPIQGMRTVGTSYDLLRTIGDIAAHLALPAIALGLTEMAVFVRVTRASMLEVVESDFVRTARSKGIGDRKVLVNHALRNALLPIITIAAIRLRNLFAGAILVELIFAWPGIGSLTIAAMTERDYPMILGITLWAAVVTVVINLLTDIAYSIVDPRIVQW